MNYKLSYVLLALLFCFPAYASMWQTPDQQAANMLQQGDPKGAAAKFNNKAWQAVANYRAGNYQAALQQWQHPTSANDYYNQGNALAHLGQYQAAIKAYDQSLQRDPNLRDAKFNRHLVKQLLKKQQQAKKKQQKNNKQQTKSSHKNQQSPQQKNSLQSKTHQAKNKGHGKNPLPAKKTQAKKSQTNKSRPAQKLNAKQLQKLQAAREHQQSQKIALQQISDNPGVLLKQIFWRDYQRRLADKSE